MNFAQLLKAGRIALAEATLPQDSLYHLTTEKAVLYFNEAIHEACRRARLLVDRTTAAICEIAVTAGSPVISYSPRIIKIRRVRLVGRETPLTRRYVADMDRLGSNWEEQTGTTDSYVADYATGKIFLHRIPAENGTLKLVVVRLPLADLTGALAEEPEIAPHYHPALVSYVVYKMRSIEDTELYDPRKAALAEAEFEREFGPKRSALNEVYEDSQPYPEYE